ncbi:hypothetical protein D3C87_1110120 [compost metagenome]
MAHADLPHLTFVHGRRAPHLHAFGVHRGAQQRHHVFPAHHRTDPPDLAVDHRQGRTIALAPDQSFSAGWHQFAVLAHQTGLRIEIQRGAVQRAAGPLNDTDDQIGAGTRRQTRQRFGFCARHIDGIGEITGEGFTTFRQAIAELRTKTLAFRITTEQRLGHHYQCGSGFDDRAFIRQNLFQRLSLAAGQGADLQCSND